jgi:hypothetical protein
MVIAQPLSTYTTCSFLLSNSILEKIYSLLFNVESGKFFLPLSSWVFVVDIVVGVIATITASVATTGVATAGGSLRCYTRELLLLHFYQQS